MTVPDRMGEGMGDRSEAAFDRALAATARSLVGAGLPADVLEVPRPAAARPWLRLEPLLASAAAIVVFAIAFAFGAPSGPSVSPGAQFRTGTQISYDLRSLGYACQSGAEAPPGEPRMDAIVCATSTQTLGLALVISEDPVGRVGEIHVSADLSGTPTTAAESDRSDQLQELIGLPFADPSAAAAARAWLAGVLPLDAGAQVRATVDRTPVVLERVGNGEYRIVLGDLHTGRSAVPSS